MKFHLPDLSRPCRALCLFLLLCFGSLQASEEYTFGVVPQFEHRKLFSVWQPIVDAVAQRSGVRLKLVASLSVPEFERELSRGHFDFVYANPYHILRESERQGYQPLVRDASPLRGIIVVARDSPIRGPADLQGRTMAVPSLNALGASLLIRADLARRFNVRVIPVNARTHSSAYMNVANGLVPAAGGVEKTLDEQPAEIRERLRILYVTRDMPSHPVAAHPRVPEALRAEVQAAFLALADTEEGREMLARIPAQRIVATSMKDFAPMRQWGLERYWVE